MTIATVPNTDEDKDNVPYPPLVTIGTVLDTELVKAVTEVTAVFTNILTATTATIVRETSVPEIGKDDFSDTDE